MRLRADGRRLDARHLCAVAHAAGNGADTVENLPAAGSGSTYSLCDPADDLKNLRCEPHTSPRRTDAADCGGYLVAVIQQVLDYFLYPCRYIRQGCAEVVQLIKPKPRNVFQNWQEIVSNLDTDSPPCVAQHFQYGFGGFAFQHKLLVHTASVFRSIAYIVQRVHEQFEVSGQLCAALNGPLAEQRFQIANLFILVLLAYCCEEPFQCFRCKGLAVCIDLLHIFCKLCRAEPQLFKGFMLCLCCFGTHRQVGVHTANGRCDCVGVYTHRQQSGGQGRCLIRVHTGDHAKGAGIVHRLCNFCGGRRIMRTQIVDLVGQLHDTLMIRIKRNFPLCGPVARLICGNVHSRSHFGNVFQELLLAKQVVHVLAGLTSSSRKAGQLFGGVRNLGA